MDTVIYQRSDDMAMKIAITRLKGKEGKDQEYCQKYGHDCIIVSPLAAKVNTDRVTAFVKSAENNEFDCIFFTSALPAQIIAPLITHWPRVIAIGPQTTRVLKSAGVACETLPTYYSRDFVPYLGTWIKGRRIGIPRADVPNPGLLEAIARAGGNATEIRCYSLVPTGQALDLQNADAILFTSAMSFRQAIWKRWPGLLVVAIGDVTASVMASDGVRPDVVGDGSLEGTLEKLNEYLASRTADR
jgi:uroporphyrinogen-III synthase